jgi:hypothetical protein
MSEFWDTWRQPLIGALHVLGVAWFGVTVLSNVPLLRKIGLLWMLATGTLLFAFNAAHVYASTAFRIKLALLGVLFFVRSPRWLIMTLWVAVIFASRGIAYF